MNTVHEAIIAKGFRETGKKRGYIIYKRGDEMIRHKDNGPSRYWPHNPDAGRHILQHFRAGKQLSGGTAWESILSRVADTQERTP